MVHDFTRSLEDSFVGQILIAMPQLKDPRFSESLILICGHDEKGAMGIVLNKCLDDFTLEELLSQLEIPMASNLDDSPVFYGGPIEVGRGFILHSRDMMNDSSVKITDSLAITGTLDMLSVIAEGNGPLKTLCALGYAGWSAGQLEGEILNNSWLLVPASDLLVFDTPIAERWLVALQQLGVAPDVLSCEIGHA